MAFGKLGAQGGFGRLGCSGKAKTTVVVNPAAFDPVHSSPSVVLSNGNLTGTGNGAGFTGAIGLASLYQSTGKFYIEFTAGTISSTDVIGMQNSTAGVTAVFPGSGGFNGVGWAKDNRVLINSATVATIATYATGNVLSMAVDLGNKKIWFRNGSGGWNNDVIANQNPASNVGGVSIATVNAGPYIFIATPDAVGDSFTINLAPTQSVPAGFGNW